MIRYFCTVSARPGTWADLGYEYFSALRQVDRIRVVPVGLLGRGAEVMSRPAAMVAGAEIVGRWEAHADVFAVPIEQGFVNVICGDGGALTHYFTVDMWNVAITAVMLGELTTAQLTALRRYDLVLCPTQADVDALGDHGITALVVPPETDALWRVMKEMLRPSKDG